ncbi:hypothetical protein PPMP20_26795 [Paraburkholderia phymatum]|uniref:Lipoprotein n=1 Tax=Paraburkholderia phymatum (strain DSM 17167 / CIP 108236 / LMG 21445 / STM815) TaxID=391038 RepID=B2JL04_PARP8|nr:hypothetical protein [Paraburkholderia phymatum]ACC72533.1 hypothetical protein Bphy_3379 [Paraburkholderia phymatum STM815]
MKTQLLIALRILAPVLVVLASACTLVFVRGDGNSFADTRGDTKGQLTVNRRAAKGPASETEPPIVIPHKSR